jgi:hypothetical protein
MRSTGTGGGDGTDLSPAISVSTRDELIALSTTPSPVFTITGSIIPIGLVPLLAGERVHATETSQIHATGPGTGGFSGDVDAALLSGHLDVSNLTNVNANTGPDAYHFGMTSATRPVRMNQCASEGDANGVLVKDVALGRMTGYTHVLGSGKRAIVIDGTIGEFISHASGLAGVVADWRGVELLPTATIQSAVGIFGTAISLLVNTRRGFKISDTATFAADARFLVIGAANSGDQSLLFDQGVGDMPLSDLRLIVDGSTSGNWAACAAVGRTDLVNPVSIPYPAFPASAATPIPYKDGVTPKVVVELSPSVRWELVKDDPSPGDWYMKFSGPKVGQLHNVGVDILVDRNAGTQPISLCIEKALAATPTTWAVIPSTLRNFDNTNAARIQNSARGEATFSKDDRIRPASENLSDAVAARVYDLVVTIASS